MGGGGQSAPWHRKICQKSGKGRKNSRKRGEKGEEGKMIEKIGKKGKNREGSFILPLLMTERAGYAYAVSHRHTFNGQDNDTLILTFVWLWMLIFPEFSLSFLQQSVSNPKIFLIFVFIKPGSQKSCLVQKLWPEWVDKQKWKKNGKKNDINVLEVSGFTPHCIDNL